MAKRKKRLTRNKEKQIVLGVCAGLGDFWDVSVTFIRLMFIFLALWGGGGVILYIILAIVIAPKGKNVDNRGKNAEEFMEDVGEKIRGLVKEDKKD